jgi:NAD(P)-dependent dehydrogenase (short-subunit alcohol dehydrogenase family)
MADAPTTTTTDVLDGVDLSGRTALVTGASTGIGKETARALAAAGASVTITARTDDKGRATVEELRASVPDADVAYEVLELGSLASVRDLTDRFTASHDSLHVLIANAGIMAGPCARRSAAAPARRERAGARGGPDLGGSRDVGHRLGRPELRAA